MQYAASATVDVNCLFPFGRIGNRQSFCFIAVRVWVTSTSHCISVPIWRIDNQSTVVCACVFVCVVHVQSLVLQALLVSWPLNWLVIDWLFCFILEHTQSLLATWHTNLSVLIWLSGNRLGICVCLFCSFFYTCTVIFLYMCSCVMLVPVWPIGNQLSFCFLLIHVHDISVLIILTDWLLKWFMFSFLFFSFLSFLYLCSLLARQTIC